MKIKRTSLVACASVTGLLGLINSAHAQLALGDTIGVDFGTIAPAAGTNFNQFDGNANSIANGATLAFSAQTGATASLIDTTGALSGVDLTVENQSGQNTSRADVTNGNAGPAPFDENTIFSDVLISNDQGSNRLNPGGFLVLTFTGLDDSLAYDLVGGLGLANVNFNTTWTAGGTSVLSEAASPYNTFLGLATDGSGNLAITLTRSTHVNVAALTLTAVTPTAATDSDGDGIADNFEENFFPGDLTQLNGLATGPGPGAGTGDFDGDGLTDLEEFDLAVTTATFPTLDPTDDDSDGDTLLDGVEDGTGVWVSATQTGTSPVAVDSDNDGLSDNVETNTGNFVGEENTGTDPNIADTDGDTFADGFEIAFDRGGDPTDIDSLPSLLENYDAVGGDWLSAADFGAVDINGDGLGSDGFLFFGDFTGVGNDALTFADRVESLPTYVSAVTAGARFDRVTSGFAGYGMIDNPLTLDGTDQIAGLAATDGGALNANLEILTFEVSGLSEGQTVRVGVLGGVHNDDSGILDSDLIRIENPDGTGSESGELRANPGQVNAGWVFFDVTQEGTYRVLTSSRSSTASSGLGGLTFDSFRDSSLDLIFRVENDPTDANSLLFTWESRAGFEYDILSNTDLTIPVSSWEVYNDGSTLFENIAASGTGVNTEAGVARSGAVRFFSLQETAIPPTP